MVSGNAQVLPKRREYIYRALPFVLSIVAFLFYTLWNEREGIWFDEGVTLSIIKHNWGDMFERIVVDMQSPLYYLLLKLYGVIFGNSIGVLRSFSALGVIATAMLGFGPLKRLLGRDVGVIFAIVWLILPVNFSRAMEIRMYPLSAFFTMGTVLFGFLVIKENNFRDWIRFFLFSAVGIYTHYYAALAILYFWISMFFMFLFKKDNKSLKLLSTFGTALFIAYLPWFYFFVANTDRIHEVIYVTEINIEDILLAPFSIYLDKFSTIPSVLFYFFALVCIISVSAIVWGIYCSFVLKERELLFIAWGIFLFLGVFVTEVLIALFFHPLFEARYIYPVIPLLVLEIVCGIKKMRSNKVKEIVLSLFFIGILPEIYCIALGVYDVPVKQAVENLREVVKKEDVFVHMNQLTGVVFSYYFRDNMHILYTSPLVTNYGYIKTYKTYEPELFSFSSLMLPVLVGKTIWLVSDIHYPGCKELLEYVLKNYCEQKEGVKIFYSPWNWFNILFVKVVLKKGIALDFLSYSNSRKKIRS